MRLAPNVTPPVQSSRDRKSTRLNSSHTEIYTLSLDDALPIAEQQRQLISLAEQVGRLSAERDAFGAERDASRAELERSEEHTSELQSHRDLHSFPRRRSSDRRATAAAHQLGRAGWPAEC